ncbi:hypothetical protein [Glaciecola petra]|uniref:Lipoprotein n=1 Tax=Glaciecola petra TaxID=3075602 RepID=A0ABU2ZPI7_9ALTE|nr:hypothetical protein [Aestuariibacter sp. P117]MDT0594539.1 hypothetical protein [Aestuariibacter sp. P117]
MKRHGLLIIILFGLTGCLSLVPETTEMCKVKEFRDILTGAKVVNITECWAPVSNATLETPKYQVGFSWSSDHPDKILFISTLYTIDRARTYLNFRDLSVINQDDIKTFKFNDKLLSDSGYNTLTNNSYTITGSAVTIPFSLFENIVSSKDIKVRITTSSHSEEYDFSGPDIGMANYIMKHIPIYLEKIKEFK